MIRRNKKNKTSDSKCKKELEVEFLLLLYSGNPINKGRKTGSTCQLVDLFGLCYLLLRDDLFYFDRNYVETTTKIINSDPPRATRSRIRFVVQ